jgi:NTP pyrophosphatase (non-canonical NTP hydrolase)
MDIIKYQEQADATAIYPRRGSNIEYAALGLAGEAGEIANQVKKIGRDEHGVLTEERRQELIDELGDALWYIVALAHELKVSLAEVARRNIAKLASRAVRGVLSGSGGDR